MPEEFLPVPNLWMRGHFYRWGIICYSAESEADHTITYYVKRRFRLSPKLLDTFPWKLRRFRREASSGKPPSTTANAAQQPSAIANAA